MWAVGICLLLAIFYVVDKINFARAPLAVREKETAEATWRFEGLPNLFFLAEILGAVFIKTIFVREALMIAAAAGSYFTTKKTVHVANYFDFHPILEVVVLFAGIFATMMPALDWLNQNAPRLLGEHPAPGIFYWGTGVLSSALDNAPTYLGFLECAVRCRRHGRHPRAARATAPANPRHQRGGGVFRRGHLHRQRPELHGQGHRRAARKLPRRPSSVSSSNSPCRSWCRC